MSEESQLKKFKAAAKEAGCDMTAEEFEAVVEKIVPPEPEDREGGDDDDRG